MSNQEIKADAGKIRPTLVPNELIYDIAKIQEYDQEVINGIRADFVRKTKKKGHHWYGIFICPFCGNEFETLISNAMSGKVKSCGCAKGQLLIKSKGTHGQSSTRLYKIYAHMKERCNQPTCKEYKWYGARGIQCEFKSFQEFKEFALSNGYNDTLTVERIDVNGNYNKENVIFIPKELQPQNTRTNVMLTYKGLTLCAAEWGRILGVKGDTLTSRKRKGWSDEKVLETKVGDSIDITLVPTEIINAIRHTRLYGLRKYSSADSWRNVEIERYRDALYRHWLAYIADPHGFDEESGLPHLYHLACNCAFLCELEKDNYNFDIDEHETLDLSKFKQFNFNDDDNVKPDVVPFSKSKVDADGFDWEKGDFTDTELKN